jgi:hypothetical protein
MSEMAINCLPLRGELLGVAIVPGAVNLVLTLVG